MFFNGRAFPGFISAFAPDSTLSPTFNPAGANIYLFSPSA